MIAIIPILMMIVGALMFALSANPKVARIGELLFQAGAIAFGISHAGNDVRILH